MSRLVLSGRTALIVAALLVTASCAREDAGAQAAQAALSRGPGEVIPLTEILAFTRRIAPGKVIDVDLESDVSLDDPDRPPRWVYEIEVLTEANHVVELEIDAVTGKLIEIDGAPWPADIPREAP